MSSPLSDLDLSLVDDPDFKEDAVREEIVTPILKSLGYRASGPNKIVRSPNLEHPFVAIGSNSKKISIVPDYLLYVDGRPSWILDAKSPREGALNPKHLEQTYSYAIHRDVRVDLYAVCNGRDFVVFRVRDMSSVPTLKVKLNELAQRWAELVGLVGPDALRNSYAREIKKDFDKDLGIHLMKLGMGKEHVLHFLLVPVFGIACVNDTYTMNGALVLENNRYLGTFEFSADMLGVILEGMGQAHADKVREALTHAPTIVRFSQPPVTINIEARLSGQIEEAKHEHFMRMKVLSISLP